MQQQPPTVADLSLRSTGAPRFGPPGPPTPLPAAPRWHHTPTAVLHPSSGRHGHALRLLHLPATAGGASRDGGGWRRGRLRQQRLQRGSRYLGGRIRTGRAAAALNHTLLATCQPLSASPLACTSAGPGLTGTGGMSTGTVGATVMPGWAKRSRCWRISSRASSLTGGTPTLQGGQAATQGEAGLGQGATEGQGREARLLG